MGADSLGAGEVGGQSADSLVPSHLGLEGNVGGRLTGRAGEGIAPQQSPAIAEVAAHRAAVGGPGIGGIELQQ